MRRWLIVTSLLALGSMALAQAPTYFVKADMVRGAQGAQGPVCVPNSVFFNGEMIVFRAVVYDAATGEELKSDEVNARGITATVYMDGRDPTPMFFPPPAEGDHALRSGVHWIDVMIVYTSNVQVEAGGHAGVAARAHNDVPWTNRAFMNTAMPVRFRLVAVKRMSLTEDPDMDDMLPATRGNSQVNNWRNQYGADMVGVYVSQGQYCGLGYVMRNPGPTFERSAYQVTRFNCGAATYAHEHGHNMGMEHNPDNASASPSEASYPWSFGHGVAAGGNSFRTIMAYAAVCNGDPCPRIRSFSATGYIYNDIPIGVANSSENSRTGSLTAPVVAAFRPSVMLFQNGFDYGFID